MPAGRERANFEQLYVAVSEELASGRHRPGDRIGLTALASRLGVSVTPLREVLSRLVGRDMIMERRREGYYLAHLDARDVADLYNLHHACIERALARPLILNGEDKLPAEDIWTLFDFLVAASGDRILAGVRRYLDDRLMLIRRYEHMLLRDEDSIARDLQSAILRHDVGAIRNEVGIFHVGRADQAGAIADLANRHRAN